MYSIKSQKSLAESANYIYGLFRLHGGAMPIEKIIYLIFHDGSLESGHLLRLMFKRAYDIEIL